MRVVSAPAEGRCLCGAVRVRAALAREISACHCEMCRRWSGGILMGIEAPVASVEVEGPVARYRSSGFAERAWCRDCGSALWLRNVEGEGSDVYELVPGLFEEAGGARLSREVYADRCPAGYALAGDHARVTAADYAARNRTVEGP